MLFLKVLCAKKEKLNPDYVSKHSLNREKQLILLVILRGADGIILW